MPLGECIVIVNDDDRMPKLQNIGHISSGTFIPCTYLLIWHTHWRFVFEQEAFYPNGVVASASRRPRQIET